MRFPANVKSIDLDICDLCNLACIYCFHEDMRGTLAPKELIDKVLDSIPSPQPEGGFKIHFFGGEPLLAMKEIKYMVSEANQRGMKMRYGVTSNLTKLTPEIAAYFKENNISIHCSIDGNSEVQDRQRIKHGGQGTSHIIEDKVKHALNISPKATMRMTIMAKSAPHYFDSVKYAFNLGFTKAAPVCVPEDSWTKEDLTILESQLRQTAEWAFQQASQHSKYHDIKFISACRPGKRTRGGRLCGAGCSNIAIGLGGDIYPCHRFSRADALGMHWLGNIFQENWLQTFHERRVKVNNLHNNDFEICYTCPAFDVCSGGCPHINVTSGTEEYKEKYEPPLIYCEIKRMEVMWGNWFWRKVHNVKLNRQRKQSYDYRSSKKKPSSRGKKQTMGYQDIIKSITPEQYQKMLEVQKELREKLIKK